MSHSPDNRRQRLLAMALTGLAGYVDAVGYLKLGGFFVSFMSGNATRLAIGLVSDAHAAAVALAVIGAFSGGAMLGTLLGHRVRPQNRSSSILVLVAGCLAVAALAKGLGGGRVAILAVTLAMGAENTVFEHDRAVGIGVTYMTWTLVTLGKCLAEAALGGDRWAWLPQLLLWASFVAGAAFGAEAYQLGGLDALWGAVAAAGGLALITMRYGPLHKSDFTT